MKHSFPHIQGAFYVVEKRVPIFEPEVLEKLCKLGAQISGGDGKIHAHMWIPRKHYKEILETLDANGFYISDAYEQHR